MVRDKYRPSILKSRINTVADTAMPQNYLKASKCDQYGIARRKNGSSR